MTNMHAKSGDNIILEEDDNTIVKNKEECQIFNEYFANIASSIGFGDSRLSVDDTLHKHSNHPSVIKIKEGLTGPNILVSKRFANQKLMTIDIKKPQDVILSQARSYVWPTTS